jgi:nicotinate phosphoribosyltransferase
VNSLSSALLTDLYQLTMLHAYYVHRMNGVAVFELFVRRLPNGRNFLIAAGLEQALSYLENVRFSNDELEWMRGSDRFGSDFVEHLAALRFTGDVYAMREGTVFFPQEPVLRVVAPLPEAQLVETRLMNLIHFQLMIASKAARSVLVAPDKLLVDFGLRRAHGAEAGLLAARAAYIAGFSGTATVLAAAEYGIPLYGTMAHSFVQAHDDETDAFEHFLEVYPQGSTLLIDTYDTEEGARKIVRLAKNLAHRGLRIAALRLDSGDLAGLARSVREILDQGGLDEVKIFASGNLEENRIAELVAGGAPIDGFGLGTSLVTSADAPALDTVYKLQEYGGKPRRKRSAGKATWPGRKQVFRNYDEAGRIKYDVVSTETDSTQKGEPLLVRVMTHGRRVGDPEALSAIRARSARELERLPVKLRTLAACDTPYSVQIAATLHKLAEDADDAASATPLLFR